MREAIRQSKGTRVCGQIAVAVIAGISLAEAIAVFGSGWGTNTRAVVAALRKLGYDCPDRLRRMQPPQLGIGKLTLPNTRNWHWVVIDDGWIIDGCVEPFARYGWPIETIEPAYAAIGKRITSWLPVTA